MTHDYFISDLHLGHSLLLKEERSQFASIEEHDAALLYNCNLIPKASFLWLLGDVAFQLSAFEAFMAGLRPDIKPCLIRGNHDDRIAWKMRARFHFAAEAHYLVRKVGNEDGNCRPARRAYLSHYSHRVWRNSHHGAIHLYGHSHGNIAPWPGSVEVSANVLGFMPISFSEALQRADRAASASQPGGSPSKTVPAPPSPPQPTTARAIQTS